MKPRHAAALALVGWYLMVPPRQSDGWPDLAAPVSEWTALGDGFADIESCEAFLSRVRESVLKLPPGSSRDRYQEGFAAGTCAPSSLHTKHKDWAGWLPVSVQLRPNGSASSQS
jgi:hypothetical protein